MRDQTMVDTEGRSLSGSKAIAHSIAESTVRFDIIADHQDWKLRGNGRRNEAVISILQCWESLLREAKRERTLVDCSRHLEAIVDAINEDESMSERLQVSHEERVG